jgi:hypothetical protein
MSTEVSPAITPFRMHSGAALRVSELSRVCRQSYTPIVFMAGEIKSGKTTLIASIHDAFLFGPLGDYRFAGSETLYAFEERAFESRASEQGDDPQTPRTRYESGQEYFHLRLMQESTGEVSQILFADMSGEFYERALFSQSEVNQFGDLKRAQVLLLLLDGTKLASTSTRQSVRANALQFLLRCKEERLLPPDTKLQVLISKWDAVPVAQREECLQFVRSRISEAALHRQVEIMPVASRPGIGKKDEKLFGVRDLFPDWVKMVPSLLQSDVQDALDLIPFTRASLNSLRELPK